MRKYRCPYCGKETFPLLIKLGLNLKFDVAPRCHSCKRVSVRKFVVGGNATYYLILFLSAILTACGTFASVEWDFEFGIILFPLAFIAFYLLFNYYFCYFDRVKEEGINEIINLQLMEVKDIWPDIRKGEIYVIGLLNPYDFASARDGYVIAMLENKFQDKLQFRILSKPPVEYFQLRGEVAIYSGNKRYAATLLTQQEPKQNIDAFSNDIEIIKFNCEDKKITDWKYDFLSLPKWDYRTRFPYVYDLFVEMPNIDKLFCIYSVVEASMMSYIGRLAILKNKQNPELEFCSSDDIIFTPVVFLHKSENLLFSVARTAYIDNFEDIKEALIIFDLKKGVFSYFTHEGVGGFYKVDIKSKGFYELRHEEFSINRITSKTPLIKQIDINDLNWYPLESLNELRKILFNN